MENKSDKDKLNEALYKRAFGYTAVEQNEEYAVNDGVLTLIKKKITTKEVPPELSAIKMLLEQNSDDLAGLTEEELEKEKIRLIGLLKKETDKRDRRL